MDEAKEKLLQAAIAVTRAHEVRVRSRPSKYVSVETNAARIEAARVAQGRLEAAALEFAASALEERRASQHVAVEELRDQAAEYA